MLLSAGEMGLGDKIAEGGRKAKAGQLLRLVDVPADAGRGLGLFEDTKGSDPASFAKAIKAAALSHYGTAGPAFVEELAKDPGTVAQASRRRVAEIQHNLLHGIGEATGQVSRVALRFALIAAAGELGRVALGLPWAEGEAERAAAACFEAWQGTLGGDGPGELVASIEALRAAVEKHGESRFRSLGASEQGLPPLTSQPVRDLLGYRFTRDDTLLWGFTATGWREVLFGIADPKGIARMLDERGGLLVSGSDHARRFILKVDGQSVAVFAVRASFLLS
jgi:putative DNA primase/helicase